jgi:hypothetical protein
MLSFLRLHASRRQHRRAATIARPDPPVAFTPLPRVVSDTGTRQ